MLAPIIVFFLHRKYVMGISTAVAETFGFHLCVGQLNGAKNVHVRRSPSVHEELYRRIIAAG